MGRQMWKSGLGDEGHDRLGSGDSRERKQPKGTKKERGGRYPPLPTQKTTLRETGANWPPTQASQLTCWKRRRFCRSGGDILERGMAKPPGAVPSGVDRIYPELRIAVSDLLMSRSTTTHFISKGRRA